MICEYRPCTGILTSNASSFTNQSAESSDGRGNCKRAQNMKAVCKTASDQLHFDPVVFSIPQRNINVG